MKKLMTITAIAVSIMMANAEIIEITDRCGVSIEKDMFTDSKSVIGLFFDLDNNTSVAVGFSQVTKGQLAVMFTWNDAEPQLFTDPYVPIQVRVNKNRPMTLLARTCINESECFVRVEADVDVKRLLKEFIENGDGKSAIAFEVDDIYETRTKIEYTHAKTVVKRVIQEM